MSDEPPPIPNPRVTHGARCACVWVRGEKIRCPAHKAGGGPFGNLEAAKDG